MQAKKIGILLLCGMLAACAPGCGKSKTPYTTTEQAEEYEELKNIKIYSDTSTDSADSNATISGRTDTDSSKAESAITSGGSTDSKPTGTPTPTASVSGSGGSSGGSTGASGAGTWPSSGWVSSGTPSSSGGGSSSNDPFTSSAGGNSGSDAGSSGQSSSASSSPAAIIKSITVNETQIADKNGVSVVATGTSDNGIDVTVTNTNSRPVKVLIDNVIVNNRKTSVNTEVEVPANGQVQTSIPLTDAVLKELNISKVHDITVDVDISNSQTSQTTSEETANTPQPDSRSASGGGDSQSSGDVREPSDDGSSETNWTNVTQDPGPMIASYDGLRIYATYVKNDFIFNSGLLITVENDTERQLRLTSDSVVVNGDQSAGGIMMDARPGTSQVCFNVGSSKLFSNAREITLNLKISERFTSTQLYETGDITIQAN